MYVHKHVILGFLFSLVIYPFIGYNSLIVFLSSFLIDFDHYLYYFYKTGSLNLWKAVDYFLKKERRVIMIFHTTEFLTLIFILSFFWYWFIYILLGISFHLVLDIYHSLYYNKFSSRKFSLFA